MDKLLLKISQSVISLLIFLVPLIILPLVSEFIVLPKIYLFIVFTLIVFCLWLINQLLQRRIELKENLFLYPLFLISLSNIISLVVNFNHLDKFSALWNLLPFLIFPLFSWLFVQLFSSKKTGLIEASLITSAAFVAGLGIYLFLLPSSAYPQTISFFGNDWSINNFSFSPAGTNLISLAFLISVIPLIIKSFSGFFKEEGKKIFLKALFLSLLALVILTAIGIFSFQAVSLGPASGGIINLPYSTGWVIAVTTFRSPLNALVGVGPGNFLTAFTKFKPINYNLTGYWNLRFTNSANEAFQIITTLGLLGLATYIYLVSQLLKTIKNLYFWPAAILALSMLILPSNFFLYFLLVVYLSLIALKENPETKSYSLGPRLSLLLIMFAGLFTFFSFYFLGRNFLAEVSFTQSIKATNENRAVDTYNLQIKAISLNPYKANYHQQFSQTNLALANSLASQKDLSDEDKQRITQLVQQSIREARSATLLGQENVTYWENLAAVYRQLINFAQGSENWAVNSLNKAIEIDPLNPQLYLNLGGIHYFFNRYDDAINLFRASVNLKADFANGWYNLASAYTQKKEYQKAYDALNQVLKFVSVDSVDYQKAQKDLEEVKTKLPQTQAPKPATGEATLKLPEPFPSLEAKITPIELPTPEELPQ